jgi:chromosome segregation ATPase
MARPLATSDPLRNGVNGSFSGRSSSSTSRHSGAEAAEVSSARAGRSLLLDGLGGEAEGTGGGLSAELLNELEQLRSENHQLRALCAELEQALHEATQHSGAGGMQAGDLEALLEEKNEVIRQLHQQVQELNGNAQAALAEAEAAAARPIPREAELLALSEELERERRQLQEDETTLMEQMREMEIGMARERAELARQRNDLQRLQSEIRHELERLERNGALQSKMESLKSKLQDATTRRGAAPNTGSGIFKRIFRQNGSR